MFPENFTVFSILLGTHLLIIAVPFWRIEFFVFRVTISSPNNFSNFSLFFLILIQLHQLPMFIICWAYIFPCFKFQSCVSFCNAAVSLVSYIDLKTIFLTELSNFQLRNLIYLHLLSLLIFLTCISHFFLLCVSHILIIFQYFFPFYHFYIHSLPYYSNPIILILSRFNMELYGYISSVQALSRV